MYFENTIANGRDNYYVALNFGFNQDVIILKIYDEYRDEQKIYQKNKYYSKLWDERKIYK